MKSIIIENIINGIEINSMNYLIEEVIINKEKDLLGELNKTIF